MTHPGDDGRSDPGPHSTDSRPHAAHDPELVAALAAGDATGSALAAATALVAGCEDCAALHRDLRAIAAAMPTLPVPVRPRDFRLTPEQAAALRPAGAAAASRLSPGGLAPERFAPGGSAPRPSRARSAAQAEPVGALHRQGPDMPHSTDSRPHAAHDPELVAALAAGDATGSALAAATALVAGCEDCAALHRDLRAIAAAMPTLPVPVRPRDFRLTPEQAAALRPAGWRRIAAVLAGPGFRFAAPLGTGLAALGLAGVLVGSLVGAPLLPGAGSTSAMLDGGDRAIPTGGAGTKEAPAAVMPSAAPSAATSAGGVVASAFPNFAPAASPSQGNAPGPADAASAAPVPPAAASALPPVPGQAEYGAQGSKTAPTGAAGTSIGRTVGLPLALLGGTALLLGLALVGLRWGSRRIA